MPPRAGNPYPTPRIIVNLPRPGPPPPRPGPPPPRPGPPPPRVIYRPPPAVYRPSVVYRPPVDYRPPVVYRPPVPVYYPLPYRRRSVSRCPGGIQPVLNEINAARARAGMPGLIWDETLARAAQAHASTCPTTSMGNGQALIWAQTSCQDGVTAFLRDPYNAAKVLNGSTTRVGCGYGMNCGSVVCHFDPPALEQDTWY